MIEIKDLISILYLIMAAIVAVYTISTLTLGTSEYFLGIIVILLCLISSRLISLQQLQEDKP